MIQWCWHIAKINSTENRTTLHQATLLNFGEYLHLYFLQVALLGTRAISRSQHLAERRGCSRPLEVPREKSREMLT